MEFGLQSMHPLFTFNFRFIVKLFIITLPVIIVLIYVEYGLNHLDTHYLKKRIDLEKQLNSIEILSLGSSNAYFGINPSQFSCPGFNLAFNAQSMYYDLAFIEKYIHIPRVSFNGECRWRSGLFTYLFFRLRVASYLMQRTECP